MPIPCPVSPNSCAMCDAVSRQKTLQRLLHIREIEEEQKRLRLAAAMTTLDRLATARDAAVIASRDGRNLVAGSAISGDIADRQSGLVQTESAQRRARRLEMQIAESREETIACRHDFLTKRVERRQAETVLQHEDAREKLESARKSQRNIDDWYGIKTNRQAANDQGDE